ncbi:hypothetical protein QT826_22525, partial [Xanthomonas citri pv. citri]
AVGLALGAAALARSGGIAHRTIGVRAARTAPVDKGIGEHAETLVHGIEGRLLRAGRGFAGALGPPARQRRAGSPNSATKPGGSVPPPLKKPLSASATFR